MSVSLRLTRIGKKKRPFYRIVAVDKRKARDGKYIEKLGHYDPLKADEKTTLSKEIVFKWLKVGAEPTQTVKQIFSKEGLLMEWEEVKKSTTTTPKKKKTRKSRLHPMAEKLKIREEAKKKNAREAEYRKQKAKKVEAEEKAAASKAAAEKAAAEPKESTEADTQAAKTSAEEGKVKTSEVSDETPKNPSKSEEAAKDTQEETT